MPLRRSVLVVALVVSPVAADGPKDNLPENVRPIPPKGIDVPPATLAELKAGLADFRATLDGLPAALKGKSDLHDLLPDVEVYHKAVRYAVEWGEFFAPKDVDAAKNLLTQGRQRAKELRDGKPSWPTATGLVVRGYRSKIDGSVQPYGLVVPKSYDPAGGRKHRLDFWWHGRGETLSEVNFIDQRQKNPGEFTPPDALVLHPYGRYCNANKFAGEIDTLECLEHAKKHYRIDESRVVARGFSMGGAACWQFAVHYPTLWAAAAPGAGFAETKEFLGNFQNETVKPTWWEERLWHWYDATDHAQNLFNLPTVAYSGEIDKQKQAADVMAREMKKVGLELTHVIGPKTAHKYEPGAKAEVNRRIDSIVELGKPVAPIELRFTTYTLRYNRCGWLTVGGLERHWAKPATVSASLSETNRVFVKTEGVTELTIDIPPGAAPATRNPEILIDRQKVYSGLPASDRSIRASFRKGSDGTWKPATESSGLAKRPGLQGPIDDAFMDRFLVIRPTGRPANEKAGAWAAGEMKHAVEHWRKQFRGDAPVKDDTSVTDVDIASSHLILWGDPSSNLVLKKIADKLPVKWNPAGLVVGDKTYDSATHVPVLIYPNPLNPAKYVVLNSGFTFREYDYLNNARQVPKLPDYAVIDVTTPPSNRWPGKVVRAGFFGEKWEMLPDDGK